MIRALHIFGQMNRGGAELRTLELMPLMRRMGVQFDFCTTRQAPGTLDDQIRQMGGEVIPCPMTLNRFSFSRRFARLLKRRPYDIVHSHVHLSSGWIIRVADHAGVPGRVIHFRSTGDGVRQGLLRRVYSKTMRHMADRHANAVLAVCEAAMISAWGGGWRNDSRARVIYNGIDLNRYAPTPGCRHALCRELGIDPRCLLVVHVGRLVPAKGHDILIEAADRVVRTRPEARFLLVGEGPQRAEIEAMIVAKGLRQSVLFLGERDDVPAILRAADCSVLTSRREGLPGVVLESVAAGTPVVAVDLPGVLEIAAHTNRVHVVPGLDPTAIADELIHTIDHPAAGRDTPFPKLFDLNECARQWAQVYHGIIPDQRKRLISPSPLTTHPGVPDHEVS